MIIIKEIAFTGYPVTDMARARAFYEGVLRLETSVAFEHEGRHWVEYDIGAGTLAISNMSPTWKPAADGPNIALEVADFDAAVAELKAHGTHFSLEPVDWPLPAGAGARSRWQQHRHPPPQTKLSGRLRCREVHPRWAPPA